MLNRGHARYFVARECASTNHTHLPKTVVTDKGPATSRIPDDIPSFNEKMIQNLRKEFMPDERRRQ
jgi:hypothetical protein